MKPNSTRRISIIAVLASTMLLGSIIAPIPQTAYAATLTSAKVFTTDDGISAASATYLFTFKAVSSGSIKRIDITAPSGYDISGGIFTGGSVSLQAGTLTISGQTMRLTLPSAISAGIQLTLQVSGINNPSTVGPHTFDFATKNNAGTTIDSGTASITLLVAVPDGSISLEKLGADVFSYIDDLISGLRTELLAAIGVEETERTEADSTQQTQLDSLQSDIDALKGAVQIDGTSGEVTINSPDNIVLQPGTDKMVKTMGDSEVMGDNMVQGEATLEGSVEMMEDATVMGDSALEGQLTAMSDASIQGFLTLPGQENTIVDGVITPTGSSILVEVSGQQGLHRIEPAAVGTELTIRFRLDDGERLGIVDCAQGTFGTGECDLVGGPFGEPNIDTNTPGFTVVAYEEDGIMKLLFTSDGIWEELSRTEPTIYAVIIGTDQNPPTNTFVPPNASESFTVSCNEGDIAVGGNIESIQSEPFTIDGTKIVGSDYTIEITNGPNPSDFRITATCIHLM